MSTHIESKINDISETVIMPGDPKRCEYIASKYLENVRLVNNVRGMTAYTGLYKNKKITIFPSGMGAPSMGIYSYELFKEYNVKNIIRVGTMGAYTNLNLKDIVLADNSYTDSNFGMVMCNYSNNFINSSSYLNNLIVQASNNLNIKINKGNVYSTDVFYEQNNLYEDKVKKYNVLGVEMESFALFLTAKFFNRNASSLFMVSDSFLNPNVLSSSERERGLDNAILIALESALNVQ